MCWMGQPMDPQSNQEWQSREAPVREDMGLQRNFWRAQAAGWTVAAALILAAIAGLFSDGPVSQLRRVEKDVAVEYQRFYRSGASASFVVELQGEQDELVISNNLAEALVLETVRPTPLRTAVAADGMHLVFDASDGGRIFFGIRPERFGMVSGIISAGKQRVSLKTYVYP